MITFGGYQFADPQPLGQFRGAPLPAIYCFAAFDVHGSPQPYRPIFIGQTNTAAAKVVKTHPAITCWTERGGFMGLLHVSVLYLPYVRERERTALVKKLVAEFSPELNKLNADSKVSD